MVLLLSRVTGVPGFYISKQPMKPLKLEVPDLGRLVIDAFLHSTTHALNLFLPYFLYFILVSYVEERPWWPIKCLKKGR